MINEKFTNLKYLKLLILIKLIDNDYEKIIITNIFIFISFINITFSLRKYKIKKYKIKKKIIKNVTIFNLFHQFSNFIHIFKIYNNLSMKIIS